MYRYCALIALTLNNVVAYAGEDSCVSDPPTIKDVVEIYSDRTGTKFILDPRVTGRVNLVGLEADALDNAALSSIFVMYGYTAITEGEIVYVVPEVDSAIFIEKLKKAVRN